MKKISFIATISLIIILATGCASKVTETIQETPVNTVNENNQEEVSIENISVNVAAPTGAPTLSMIKMFKENPSFGDHVEINYESINSPDLLASRIISGEVDIAVVPTNLAASLYNRGIDYKLAASVVWGVLYVVGNEEINDWESLRGKEIHTIGRGLTPDIVLRYILSSNGIDP